MLSGIMLSGIMLSGIMLSGIMLSVIMLSAIMLNGIMLSVVAPIFYHLLSRIFYTNLYIDLSFSQPMFLFNFIFFCKFISRFEAEPVYCYYYYFIYFFIYFLIFFHQCENCQDLASTAVHHRKP